LAQEEGLVHTNTFSFFSFLSFFLFLPFCLVDEDGFEMKTFEMKVFKSSRIHVDLDEDSE